MNPVKALTSDKQEVIHSGEKEVFGAAEVTGKQQVTRLNENGSYLLHLCCSNGLRIVNMFFQHREVHNYTWYPPSKDKNL